MDRVLGSLLIQQTWNSTESTRTTEARNVGNFWKLMSEKNLYPYVKHISCVSVPHFLGSSQPGESLLLLTPPAGPLLSPPTPVSPAMGSTGLEPDGKTSSKVPWVPV